mgnify:CR=1 FL=1
MLTYKAPATVINPAVDTSGSMKIKGEPPLTSTYFGKAIGDVRKKGNPHSTDYYTYGKK